jgi:cytochrome c oxidase subunit 2
MIEQLLGLPVNASTHGARIDQLIFYLHILMVVLFVGWGAFFLYTLFRFRRANHPKADHDGVKSHASSYLEAGVALVEVALLIGISIPFWSWKVSAFPSDNEAIRVRVIAQQFAWNVQYAGPDGKFGRTDIKLVNEQTNPIGLDRKGDPSAKDDIVTINQLHLVAQKPAIIELTTKDVIHSFALQEMRVKQDTMPGMSIPIHFTPALTSEQVRERKKQTLSLPVDKKPDGIVAMADYSGKDGSVIVKKGKMVTDAVLTKLVEAGITFIEVGPRTPMEISCAQLCGIGHYRMRGFLTVHDEKGFKEWMDEELENLE